MSWTTTELTGLLVIVMAFFSALNIARLQLRQRVASLSRRVNDLNETISAQQNALTHIREAIESTAGGIGKRVWENIEIAESINSRSPELFQQCPSLVYNLHATDQFLNALCDAMADGLNHTQRELVELQKTERTALFIHLYDTFDLERPQTKHDTPTEISGAE